MKDLLKPVPLLAAALTFAAFTVSLFFGGFRDLHYAPAILALALAGCVAVLPSVRRGFAVPAAASALWMFGLWFYVTLSLAWSSVPYASLVTWLVLTACPLVFFSALIAPGRDALVRTIAPVLLAGLAGAGLWAAAQVLFFSDTYGVRAHHPLQDPNSLAGLLSLGFLPALALFFAAQEKSRLYWGGLGLTLILFAGIVATESRSGMIGALIAAAVLAFILRGALGFKKRLLMAAISAVAIFVLLGLADDMRFAARLADLAAPAQDGSSLARIAIWRNTWEMIKDHPGLGTGLGTFYLYYPAHRLPGADNSTGSWAHMDPLQYWAEMGIAAPLLFYGLCVAVLIRTIRAVRILPKGAPDRAAIAGLFCGLLAMVTQTHASFHLYIMPILIVTGAWLALWYHLTAQALGGEGAYKKLELENWQKPFMGGVTVIVALLIGVMAASSAAGQFYLLRARDDIKQGLTERFVASIESAERWAPRSFIDPELQLAAFYIDLLGASGGALFSPEEQKTLYDETLSLLAAAQSANPPWAEVDYKRGQLYAIAPPEIEAEGKTKAAVSLETAVRKNPMHFRARQELAALYIRQGRVEKAYTLLEDGLKYPHAPDVDTAYAVLINGIDGLVGDQRAYEARKGTGP